MSPFLRSISLCMCLDLCKNAIIITQHKIQRLYNSSVHDHVDFHNYLLSDMKMFLNLSLCIHTNPIFMLRHLQCCLLMKKNDAHRDECYSVVSQMAAAIRPSKTVI